MGYWITLIGSILTIAGALLTLVGFLISPNDNFIKGPNSINQKFINKPSVVIKDSPGATINIDQSQVNYTSNNLNKDGATPEITNKLLGISKIIKEGRLDEAETSLRNFDKQSLGQVDLTNIQSVRASLYLIKGKLPEAKAIYEAILDTNTKSNAVYTGLATIYAFEAFGLRTSNPEKSKEYIYKSNDYYYKAIDIDKRPQVLVTIYQGIYDNFSILVNFFNVKSEIENFERYKKLFEEVNSQAGFPFKPAELIELEKKTSYTKSELQTLLRLKGLNFDISSLPSNAIITGYSINSSDQENPFVEITSTSEN